MQLRNLAVISILLVPCTTAPVPSGPWNGSLPDWSPAEKTAFEHFNANVKSAFENLSSDEQEIIHRKTMEMLASNHPVLSRRTLSKRVAATASWEWLIKTLGEDVVNAAVKNGHVLPHPPAGAAAPIAAAEQDMISSLTNKYGGYVSAFALGAVVASYLSNKNIDLPFISPATTTVAAAPATTTVLQMVQPVKVEALSALD